MTAGRPKEKRAHAAAWEAIREWFQARGWTPFAFQQQAWVAYHQGQSGLIHAPTGLGKTYAAWFGSMMEALAEDAPPESRHAPALRILWITPLRALATDLHKALAGVVEDLSLSWAVACRTGDTAAAEKKRQKERLPTALVTTPESLNLLLSYPGAKERFGALRAVVVDEWHELLGSKRGLLAELALMQLRAWRPDLITWGLSATLGNIEVAMDVLLGQNAHEGLLIRGQAPKTVAVKSLLPTQMERFPWAGHLGLRLLPQVVEQIDAAGSVLVFTNTRAQTEIWYQALTGARPDWKKTLALHHGSLDRATREDVEDGLRSGRLKGVICTSSLDLGVDFSPVDLVLQIGSPKGLARLLQRAGRSGHQPGAVSRVVCVPTHALELVEVAAARRSLEADRLEPRTPITLALDVLAQFLVTAAAGEGFEADAMFRRLQGTHAYRDLTPAHFDWVLNFVSSGGASLSAYPEFRKMACRKGRYTVASDAAAARHRTAIGTITDDAALQVQFVNGRRLGSMEERFAARLKRGDVFVFAGRRLEYVRIRDMTLYVRRSRRAKGPIPQWLGGRMPLSTELAAAVRQALDRAARGRIDGPEMTALKPILDLQARWSVIPRENELLMETCVSRDGHHLFLFPFEGHLVNEGLATLLAYRLTRTQPLTLSIAVNDYGLELLADGAIPLAGFLDGSILCADHLLEDILASVNAAELGRRQFREIARVAGLVFQGYPGRRKARSQIQASSSLLYKVFQRYEPQNLLLEQATREVLARQLEYGRLRAGLQRMAQARLRQVDTGRLTPLAFPIMVNRLRTRLSSEKLADRVARLQLQLERKADRRKTERPADGSQPQT